MAEISPLVTHLTTINKYTHDEVEPAMPLSTKLTAETMTATTTTTESAEEAMNRLTQDETATSKVFVDEKIVNEWQMDDVLIWADKNLQCSRTLLDCLRNENIDGQVLLTLSEEDVRDMRYRLGYNLTFGELKKFWLAVLKLQIQAKDYIPANLFALPQVYLRQQNYTTATAATKSMPSPTNCPCPQECPSFISDCDAYLAMSSKIIPPEYFKTAISLGYSFLVTWITSFVMVIVHERVPDMKRYPPLPDIFLDNVPHIPWAFNMCEVTGTLLFSIWMVVIIFHRYRTVLLRRFFALAGTVFLLRCVTMLITSLSVPGTHLQCNQKDFAIDDQDLSIIGALWVRMRRAYTIWSGLGMSIQGVRTCGDYMFSGHTVALTLLNFFITEYTPRNLYFLHTLTWLLNMFGIFFILAAHEHYSIDVFVAFYITSRLFLYYHTLANNQALMQSDSTRTRIWFPMFSYFESSVEGIIPNVYDSFGMIVDNLMHPLILLKENLMMIAYRIWRDPPLFHRTSEHLINAATSTTRPVAAVASGAQSTENDLKYGGASTFFSIKSSSPSCVTLKSAQRQQQLLHYHHPEQQQQQQREDNELDEERLQQGQHLDKTEPNHNHSSHNSLPSLKAAINNTIFNRNMSAHFSHNSGGNDTNAHGHDRNRHEPEQKKYI